MSGLSQGLLVCDTLAEARLAAAACQQWMVEHVPGYAGEFWDEPRQRKSDGKFSIYVDERVVGGLERARRERGPLSFDERSLAALSRARRGGVGGPVVGEEWQVADKEVG